MKSAACAGMSLVELLIAMAIASLVGSMILQMVIGFQSRILAEVARNDLLDRAERLIRFLSSDIGEAAFLLGPEPLVAGGAPLALVHDSLSGDPLEELPLSILPADSAGDDDPQRLWGISRSAPFLVGG
jgi:prepilin-type N-terminal cleavage/methylation domain-containing protein